MPQRSKSDNPELLRRKLVELLTNFEEQLKSDDLRFKVLSLVPCQRLFRNLGCSLIPKADADSGRERILAYLRKYTLTVIGGEELAIVSGINDWPRRVRELRVEYGWSILSGLTAKEMKAEGEFPIPSLDAVKMRTDDYILISADQDRDAAHRWNVANEIRKQKGVGVRDKILDFLKQNVGRYVTGEELRYVANDKTEWARRVRELRTEQGWTVTTKQTGRDDLPVGVYILESLRQLPPHDREIPDDVRVAVLTRDHHCCVKCGWQHSMANPSDPRHLLELHHVEEHARGGKNTEENLITVCNVCHDKIHREARPKKR